MSDTPNKKERRDPDQDTAAEQAYASGADFPEEDRRKASVLPPGTSPLPQPALPEQGRILPPRMPPMPSAYRRPNEPEGNHSVRNYFIWASIAVAVIFCIAVCRA